MKSPFQIDINAVLKLEGAKFNFYKQIEDIFITGESLWSTLEAKEYDVEKVLS